MANGLCIKQKKTFKPVRWTAALLVAVLVGGTGFYGVRWFMTGELPPIASAAGFGMPQVEQTVPNSGTIQSYTVPATQPRYISIPSIGVADTRVYPVGVTGNNALGAPKNINDAGWYKKSAMPGSGYGATLINGYGPGYEKPGVFTNLSRLATGARVVVERGDGKKFTYRVVSNETMSLAEAIPNGMRKMTVSADSTKEGVNLMTFAGNYIPRLGQFEKRVMVRAVIE